LKALAARDKAAKAAEAVEEAARAARVLRAVSAAKSSRPTGAQVKNKNLDRPWHTLFLFSSNDRLSSLFFLSLFNDYSSFFSKKNNLLSFLPRFMTSKSPSVFFS